MAQSALSASVTASSASLGPTSSTAQSLSSLLQHLPEVSLLHLQPLLSLADTLALAATHRAALAVFCPPCPSASAASQASLAIRLLRRQILAAVLGSADRRPFSSSASDTAVKPNRPSTDSPSAAAQWRLWEQGVGWRAVHQCSMIPHTRYFVFQPGFMRLVPAGSAPSAERPSSDVLPEHDRAPPTQTLLPSSVLEALREGASTEDLGITAHTTSVATEEASSIRGSGAAAFLDHTRAVQSISAEEAESLVPDSPLFPPTPPLHSWSATQLRAFLHAWTVLHEASTRLIAERFSFNVSMGTIDYQQPHDTSEAEACFKAPLPFILPWPVGFGPGDERPRPKAVVNHNKAANKSDSSSSADGTAQSSGWSQPRLRAACHDYDLLRWEWNQPAPEAPAWQTPQNGYPLAPPGPPQPLAPVDDDCPFDPAIVLYSASWAGRSNMRLSLSVSDLSAVVRGCPWSLSVIENSDVGLRQQRLEAEQEIVGRRVAELLGCNPDAVEPITADRESPGGRRPVNEQHAKLMLDAELAAGREPDGAQPVTGPYVSDFFTRGDDLVQDQVDDPTLHLLSRLLHSSFVVGFGSEHFSPWPRLLVAPLAPGWIGGFMSGSTSFG